MWVGSLGQEESPGVENGNSLQYSCWENPMDRGAWWAPVHRVAQSGDTTEATQHAACTSPQQFNCGPLTAWEAAPSGG